MRKTSKIILITIVATSILLGLGYAAIQNITLNVTGSAAAAVNQENFDVRFTRVIGVSDNTCVTANVESDQKANIVVSGLTAKGQFITATYEIKNYSQDLSADLKIVTTNSNADYFTISSRLADKSITAGNTTTVVVTVELTKTPIDGTVTSNISVGLEAMPVQPGEEGTSSGTNDFAQAPDYRNEYGFYYNKPYSATLESGVVDTAIFYEDGSIEVYTDNIPGGKSAAGYAVYSPYTITIVGQEDYPITVSSDGTQVILYGTVYTLNENFEDIYADFEEEKNEFGFYYGQAYTYTNTTNEALYSYVINEDGSYEYYIDYELENTGIATINNNTITIDGITFTATSDGKYLSHQILSCTLDPDFWTRYNAIRYVKFGKAYKTTLANGSTQTVYFYENESAEIFTASGSIEVTEGYVKYTRDTIHITNLRWKFTVSKDGKTIIKIDDNSVYTLQ